LGPDGEEVAGGSNPGVVGAFDALRQDIAFLLELKDQVLDNLEVRSVSFTYHGDEDVMGATISCLRSLVNSDAGHAATTPHHIEKVYDGSDGSEGKLFTDEAVARLKNLIAEAWLYVEGQRAQLDIFEGDQNDPEKEEISESVVNENGAAEIHEEESVGVA
jgi:hypothetical protein